MLTYLYTIHDTEFTLVRRHWKAIFEIPRTLWDCTRSMAQYPELGVQSSVYVKPVRGDSTDWRNGDVMCNNGANIGNFELFFLDFETLVLS